MICIDFNSESLIIYITMDQLICSIHQGGSLPIVLCQKFKSSWFSDIFPFLWTQECQQVKNFQKFLISSVGASRLQFYFMIYFIVVLVRSLELKKSMKELEQPFNFFWRTYQDFLDFPKKFWGLGPSPHIGSGTPQMPHLGVPGPPDPQKFFGKSRKS